jgi:hypothetical protein
MAASSSRRSNRRDAAMSVELVRPVTLRERAWCATLIRPFQAPRPIGISPKGIDGTAEAGVISVRRTRPANAATDNQAKERDAGLYTRRSAV